MKKQKEKSKIFDTLMGIKRAQVRNCIGIYISLTDIYVAQILEKSGGIEVESLVKLSLNDIRTDLLRPAELNEAFFATAKNWLEPIKKIIDSKDWATRDVVVSLSPDFSVHRHFVMEDVPRRYWKDAVPLQARKYIHYPFERAVYDYSIRPFYAELTKNKQLEVVFSLTSKIIVATLDSGLRSIGLTLASVETAPLSAFRLFSQTDKEAQKNTGKVYANFSSYEGQFLFAINSTPVLMRAVEVNPSMGTRNRLEVNNCIDFISKQIEKNVFEDIVLISQPEQMDWVPLLEIETKKNVRKWRIEDILGFKVSGFAEIAAMGACLKFANNDVPDIDLSKKVRSSIEEIKGTIALWKITAVIVGLLFLWGVYAQISSMRVYNTFEKQKVARVDGIDEFKNLSANQIVERVANMKSNASDLSALIVKPKYTVKLNALPDLMLDDIYIRTMSLSYPIASKAGKPVNSLVVNGTIYSSSGKNAELAEGSKFNTKISKSSDMSDICRNNIKWDYPPNSNRGERIGTDFSMKCERSQ